MSFPQRFSMSKNLAKATKKYRSGGTYSIDSKKLEHRSGMIHGVSWFFDLQFQDGHLPTFRLRLQFQYAVHR